MLTPPAYRPPDFFIVGAPKCGTTSMYEYLRVHPQIFMPSYKEPHFFAADLPRPAATRHAWPWVYDETEYYNLFTEAAPDQQVGEASTWYLFSQQAARRIHQANPRARIIAMLREPAAMLFSLHGQFLRDGNETIVDFAEALRAEPDRRQGRRIPSSAHLGSGLCYSQVVAYTEQLKRYYDLFGREQVMVIPFEQFIADTVAVYDRTQAFIGVSPNALEHVETHNAGNSTVAAPTRRWLKRYPAARKWVATLPAGVRGWIGSTLRRVSPPQARQLRPDPSTLGELRHHFKDHAHQLAELTGVNFPHLWGYVPG